MMTAAGESFGTAELQALERNTFVRRAEFLPVVDSTNTYALQLAESAPLAIPHLVIAGEQTAGRGRGANRWWSGPGALAWSLVLDAEELGLTPENWPRISLTAALAVCETVRQLAPQAACGIKWPNDVLAGGRKICGVLPELPRPVSHDRPLPNRLVLGVGLNVNNALAEAPPEIRAVATSLVDLTGRAHDQVDVLTRILGRLEQNLLLLRQGDPDLAEAWSRRCLLRGGVVELCQGERRIRGVCGGIAADGGLWLDPGEGPRRYYSGTIGRIERPAGNTPLPNRGPA
ncbi:MAG TPA: biotin--[acetyl-CoA-carboxylase] ligase [Pirellulales bacterium]|jgi:BirA family biotin operon repressor/biotin-[acetyl-CoA-carboxylase] ligase|nr:biotin--[acetyl-CoA-carboxylase] ligase [Pirellulales bacterium]